MTKDEFIRARAELCTELNHPPVTYNPVANKTWCACGATWSTGDAVQPGPHLNCCGGPLTRQALENQHD